MNKQDAQNGMRRRQIILADGRYMIFYTFDERSASSTEDHAASETTGRRDEPDAKPEALEERGV